MSKKIQIGRPPGGQEHTAEKNHVKCKSLRRDSSSAVLGAEAEIDLIKIIWNDTQETAAKCDTELRNGTLLAYYRIFRSSPRNVRQHRASKLWARNEDKSHLHWFPLEWMSWAQTSDIPLRIVQWRQYCRSVEVFGGWGSGATPSFAAPWFNFGVRPRLFPRWRWGLPLEALRSTFKTALKQCLTEKTMVCVGERSRKFLWKFMQKRFHPFCAVKHAIHFEQRGLDVSRMFSNMKCHILILLNHPFLLNTENVIWGSKLSFVDTVFNKNGPAGATGKCPRAQAE